MYEVSPLRLEQAKKKTVGTRQTLKAVERDQAQIVYIARDADQYVLKSLLQTCEEKKVPLIYLENMQELGKACGIEVKAAAAALVED